MSATSARTCPFCRDPVPLDEIDEHLPLVHPDLVGCDVSYPSGEVKSTQTLLEEGRERYIEPELPENVKVSKPTSIEFALGLDPRKVKTLNDGLQGAVASLTESQVKQFFNLVEGSVDDGYRLDRNQFWVDLMRFLVVTDASAKSEADSNAVLIGIPTGGGAGERPVTKTIAWSTLRQLAQTAFQDTGFKWRRLARFMGPTIFSAISDTKVFDNENLRGTSISQKYGISAKLWPATLSFFPAMKDPESWTEDEKLTWRFCRSMAKGEWGGSDPFDGSPTQPDETQSDRASKASAVSTRVAASLREYTNRHSGQTEKMERYWGSTGNVGKTGLGFAT